MGEGESGGDAGGARAKDSFELPPAVDTLLPFSTTIRRECAVDTPRACHRTVLAPALSCSFSGELLVGNPLCGPLSMPAVMVSALVCSRSGELPWSPSRCTTRLGALFGQNEVVCWVGEGSSPLSMPETIGASSEGDGSG